MTRRQDVTDTAIEALDHSVGRSNQAVLHVVLCTCLVKWMLSGGLALSTRAEAIREALTIVRQHLLDFERGLINDSMEKRFSIACRLTGAYLQIDPARSTVDGNVQIAVLHLIRHLRQILVIDMKVTRCVVSKGLGRFLLAFLVPLGQLAQGRHLAAFQHPMVRRSE